MRVDLYALAVSGADDPLPELRHHAERLGLEVAGESSDIWRGATASRPALSALRRRLSSGAIPGVLAPALSHLLRSTAEAGSLLLRLLDRGAVLITLDGVDSRDLGQHVRLRSGAVFVAEVASGLRARAAALGLAAARPRRHRTALVPADHLADLWHRGLSLREIRRALDGVVKSPSCSTLRRYLAVMLEAGTLSAPRRDAALAERGGLRRGGRPARRVSVDLDQLRALVEAGASEGDILRTLTVRRGKLTPAIVRRLARDLEER